MAKIWFEDCLITTDMLRQASDSDFSANAQCSWPISPDADCPVIVRCGDDYFSSPCGTFCEEHMMEHCRSCEVCNTEFALVDSVE